MLCAAKDKTVDIKLCEIPINLLQIKAIVFVSLWFRMHSWLINQDVSFHQDDWFLIESIAKVIPFHLVENFKQYALYIVALVRGPCIHVINFYFPNGIAFSGWKCKFRTKCQWTLNTCKSNKSCRANRQLQSYVAFIMVALFPGNLLIYHSCRWGGK